MNEPSVPLSHLDELVDRKVRQILAEMLGLNNQATSPASVPIVDAAPILGYKSTQQIYKDIDAGLLRVGHEVEDRRRPGRIKPRYYILIEAAQTRLQSDPHRRCFN